MEARDILIRPDCDGKIYRLMEQQHKIPRTACCYKIKSAAVDFLAKVQAGNTSGYEARKEMRSHTGRRSD